MSEFDKEDAEVRKLLMSLGVPVTLKGYRYLVEIITTIRNTPNGDDLRVCSDLYKQVATRYGITPKSVESGVREAIMQSVPLLDEDTFRAIFGTSKRIICKGRVAPSPTTYVIGLIEYLKIRDKEEQGTNE